jgi:hypothetical protein
MIEWFCKLMAAEAYRRPEAGPFAGATWSLMLRQGRRFAALVAKWQAGTLPAVRPPRKRPASERVARPILKVVLPRGFMWFRKLFPDTATPFAGTLSHHLHDPDMAALVAAAPQAGRILRPMCRMVGLKPPPYLQLPKRPRRPRPARPAKPRPPKFMDINRMSAVAWGNFVHPEHEGQHHPPNRIGYGGSWWPPKKPR